MDKSIDYLKDIDAEVLAHIESREPTHGLNWLNKTSTPLEFLILNVYRKAHNLKYMVDRGEMEYMTFVDGLEDESLDLLGYAYLVHKRIKMLKGLVEE